MTHALAKFGRIVVLLCLMLTLLATFQVVSVRATSHEEGLGLEISPPIKELDVNPGQSLEFPVQLRNITRQELLVKSQVDNFRAKDESGTPGIIFNQTGDSPYSLKGWVDDIPQFSIPAQTSRGVTVRINVPRNAEPGGHYGVVRFIVEPNVTGGQSVAVGNSVGTLVFLRVSGAVKESLDVEQFAVGQAGRLKSLFSSGPFAFTVRLKNNGNVHLKPTGYIDVFGTGGKRAATLAINNNPVRSVLPDSIRRFDETLGDDSGEPKLRFGRYRADLNLIFGANNQPVKASLHFWVIPFKQLALVLLALVVLGLVLNAKRKSKRRH
jgi:hypothetical protein